MSCTLPPFVNNQPVIAPLPAFPIVCAVNYPPVINVPDLVVGVCPDGITITGGAVSVSVGDSPGGTISVSSGQCTFGLTASIVVPQLSLSIHTGDGAPTCDADSGAIEAKITAADGSPNDGDVVNFENGASYIYVDTGGPSVNPPWVVSASYHTAGGVWQALSLPCDDCFTPFQVQRVLKSDGTYRFKVCYGEVDFTATTYSGDGHEFTNDASYLYLSLNGACGDGPSGPPIVKQDYTMTVGNFCWGPDMVDTEATLIIAYLYGDGTWDQVNSGSQVVDGSTFSGYAYCCFRGL